MIEQEEFQNNNLRRLSKKLRRNGFEYSCILRNGRSCIYSQRVTKSQYVFEVFKIRYSKTRKINGKILSAGERFPTDEDFGKSAWVYFSIEDAINKLKFPC